MKHDSCIRMTLVVLCCSCNNNNSNNHIHIKYFGTRKKPFRYTTLFVRTRYNKLKIWFSYILTNIKNYKPCYKHARRTQTPQIL